MPTKFEKLLDYLINEETEKSNALFHQIVVEKSRKIYENLMTQEMSTMEDDLQDGMYDEMSHKGMEDESVYELSDPSDDLVQNTADPDAPSMANMGGDMDSSEPASKEDVMDIKDALADLKAEFEALLSKEDDMDMDADEMDKHWMKLAVEEAEKAMQNGEIPIAAILVADGKELSRSQTMVSRKGTMAAHGELFALLEANGKIWTAPHPLVIYTNLEPCLMCVGAAMQVGVDEIVFGMRAAPDGGARYSQAIAEGGQKPPRIRGGVLEMETVALMRKLIEVNPQQPGLPYVKAMLEPYKGL